MDEARVMRGDDDRIKPAVASAIASGLRRGGRNGGFAPGSFVAFPGRADVEALVVDALLADSGGGARAVRAPEDHAPRVRGRRAGAPERDCERFFEEAAIDPTGEPPAGARRRRAPRRRGGGWQRQAPVVVVDDDDDGKPNDANDSMRNDGNDLMTPAGRRAARARRRAEALGARPVRGGASFNRRDANAAGGGGGGGAGGSRGGLFVHGLARGGDRRRVFCVRWLWDHRRASRRYLWPEGTLKEVRVLTYNVWFAEHVALADRVQGLSDVVVRSDPHALCLQEVTPNILMLLHAMPRFEAYKCTPPPAQQYFTVVLFKQSLHKKDKTVPAGAPELPRLEDGAVRGRRRRDRVRRRPRAHRDVLASESFISKAQTSRRSASRSSRTPYACSTGWSTDAPPSVETPASRAGALPDGGSGVSGGGVRNALFAGTPTGTRRRTARPLPPGWEDAWLLKGDGGPGYTYDLKRNAMMSGYLQKRLDRVFCRLEDFRVASFEMVGTTPVTRRDGSVATYVNEWKGARGDQGGAALGPLRGPGDARGAGEVTRHA